MVSLSAAIKAEALALGFDKVGVARAGPADPERRLADWLARGFHGSMDYMAATAAERADPGLIVPGARSVVAVAVSYWDPDGEGAAGADAKIARYARGDDYHGILRKRLRRLRKFVLRLAPEARVKPAIDTSAVLEREWARRAGITWIGKSTMAIAQDLGTYTFLGTLITDLELEPDDPHADRCGTCTACLDACPTDAFAAPYQLDANRCITYWTVERRDEFTDETPPSHGWLAGCDICQEVCPWNKFAKPTSQPRLRARAALSQPDLHAFASDANYATEAVRGTALQRTGGEAMQRNARWLLDEEAR